MSTTASCFAQALSLVDRNDFARSVTDRRGERGAKGFSCWDQFASMMFCQMGGANSLREIYGGLATAMGKLVHLGMKGAPARSTLAYANENDKSGLLHSQGGKVRKTKPLPLRAKPGEWVRVQAVVTARHVRVECGGHGDRLPNRLGDAIAKRFYGFITCQKSKAEFEDLRLRVLREQ